MKLPNMTFLWWQLFIFCQLQWHWRVSWTLIFYFEKLRKLDSDFTTDCLSVLICSWFQSGRTLSVSFTYFQRTFYDLDLHLIPNLIVDREVVVRGLATHSLHIGASGLIAGNFQGILFYFDAGRNQNHDCYRCELQAAKNSTVNLIKGWSVVQWWLRCCTREVLLQLRQMSHWSPGACLGWYLEEKFRKRTEQSGASAYFNPC